MSCSPEPVHPDAQMGIPGEQPEPGRGSRATVYVEAHELGPDAPQSRKRVEDAATVADVWARLGVGAPAGLVVLVNGRLANWHTVLQDGDEVRLLRAPGGG